MRARKKPVEIDYVTFDELTGHMMKVGFESLMDPSGMETWNHFDFWGKPVRHCVSRLSRSPEDGYFTIPTDEGDMKMTRADVLITGVKGEIYPCKIDIFEATYDVIDQNISGSGMDFGMAIREAKAGKKIARTGWNGKNMFVVYMPPLFLPPYNTADTPRKVNDRTAKWIGEDKPLNCQPYFAMYNAQEQWIPGWLASQSDMLAEDWEVIE